MARLDEAITIRDMQTRNRLVFPPVTTGYGTADGGVTDRLLSFYRQRSRDVGLVIVEATAVRSDGRLVPRSLGLWNDRQVQGMQRLAATIKGEGAAAAVQIVHGGARAVPVETGILRASPSSVVIAPGAGPTVLTEGQIADIVDDFATAASRAVEAGFDAVEIHGAHHYLVSQFLSPVINRREDRYGGDATGRATLAVEIVRSIRRRLGAGYPILFRFNAVELLEGGQTIEEGIVVARLLEAAGVDVLHASLIAQAGWRESSSGQRYMYSTSVLPKDQSTGNAVPYVAKIKGAVGVPVIAIGKLGDAEVAARVVEEGSADLVAIGRQMIADPETAGKILSGRGSEIVQCKECNSCFASIRKDVGLVCAVNKNPAGPAEY